MFNTQENYRNLKNNPDYAFMVYEDGKGDLHMNGEKSESKLVKNLKIYLSNAIKSFFTSENQIPRSEFVYFTFDENGGHANYPEDLPYTR